MVSTPLSVRLPTPTMDCSCARHSWNPKVREMFRAQALAVAESLSKLYPGGAVAFELMAEAYNCTKDSMTGYNASAKAAFREKMRRTYTTIDALNARWGAQYASFDAIGPPRPRGNGDPASSRTG